MKPKTLKAIALVVAATGVALVALMVTTEGEPGALPLAMVVLGATGCAGARWRARRLMDSKTRR